MGFAEWFTFISPAERKRREKRYFRKVYPIGEEQRLWEQDMLEKVCPGEKDRYGLRYALIVLREKLANASAPDPDRDGDEPGLTPAELVADWRADSVVGRLSEETALVLKAMAFLEAGARRMEELPTAEEILAAAADPELRPGRRE